MMTCWSMWTLKSSCSPIAAIGEAKASSSKPIPVEKSSTRHSGIGVPRRRSVRARGRVRERSEHDRRQLQRIERPVRQHVARLDSARREALPLPPRHVAGPRGGGPLPRQARLQPRRAPRPHRRGVPVVRARDVVGGARHDRLQAPPDRARARRRQRRRPAGAVGSAARRPPRAGARRGRVRRRRRPRRRAGAARPGARRPPHVHRHERRLPARGASAARVARRAAGGERTCSS